MAPLSHLLPAVRAVPFVRDLARHGARPAVVTTDGVLSYAELAARVAQIARQLGTRRRLVLVTSANTLDALVAYLGALHGGHPVLLVPGDGPAAGTLTEAYDPDVVIGPTDGEWTLHERRAGTAHDLHPDLALLLSTSGSTGSPKLVRLSHDNLQANAEAIADYLGIRDTDRAMTSLPLHYCYGLSVVHSHLARGAALVLTDRSVADACFWDLFRHARATTFAGVPYTFDLLDRVGFAALELPHLRYVTVAGGRLAPDKVVRYADLGRRNGWDLFVMYGQTEATARMAYLPPDLASSRPEAIGVPVPGGAFRLAPVADQPDDVGELVYAGPNVMLGYAERPADLGSGRTVEELHTGDLARRGPDGLYEIVGRRSRFAKILGLRVDPQQVEALLAAHDVSAACLGADDELLVALAGDADPQRVRRLVGDEVGLPPRAVRVLPVDALPRLATGKVDYPALRTLIAAPPPAAPPGDDLCRLYAEVLDRTDVTPERSFVDLGGDSLSYVEMSVRLEQVLGQLPPNWHTVPIGALPAPRAGLPRHRRTLETSVAVRAIAIVLIVGSHIPLFTLTGGAHLLLGVAGFNFARFQLTDAGRTDRLRQVRAGLARIVLPTMAWIAAMLVVTDQYRLSTLLLAHSLLGPDDGATEWHFWFIEALVYILIGVAALLAVPRIDRLERRHPFALPMTLAGLGLLSRYDVFDLDARHNLPTALVAFWLFALGWAAARADGVRQRLLVTAAAAATVPGFFGQPGREALIVAGFALLIWLPTVPSLGPLNRVASVLAGSSLYIYLTHWQVYPHLRDLPLVALAASLALGIGYAALVNRVGRWFATCRNSPSLRSSTNSSTKR
ncbi:AMP-binding protein [Micromonospora halophytica]|uniref:Acyl-CoA synthetase (AMP-forming)/AMP-acid ligase II n=1 Tax=Micromonospora halophytica TaxID=47864 RepID=A0A1C5J564_9ACTN|nr:AMP-binding protein [Micromonospora halophytica]SCG65712.1 Acyl-CoA synthetase (AMP-forming)/AMP-acid ligase II [Micromonospora halophytica]